MKTPVLLRLSAFLYLLFGLPFAVFPSESSKFLGTPPSQVVFIVGLFSLIHVFHLLWASLRKPSTAELYYFFSGDLVFVLMLFGLVATGTWINNPKAMAFTVIFGFTMSGLALALLYITTQKKEDSDFNPY